MSDEQQVQATDPEGQEPAGNDEKQVFPADYVQQLRQEAASYRTKLRELEQRAEEQERAKLEKQSEWQELARKYEGQVKELSPIKEQYEAMLERLRESNQKRIDAVPADLRSLIPDYDDPSRLAAWLDANADKLRKPQAPALNGGAGNGARPGEEIVLSEAEAEMARKLRLTPEQYAKHKN